MQLFLPATIYPCPVAHPLRFYVTLARQTAEGNAAMTEHYIRHNVSITTASVAHF